jgi:hypothetical protein
MRNTISWEGRFRSVATGGALGGATGAPCCVDVNMIARRLIEGEDATSG